MMLKRSAQYEVGIGVGILDDWFSLGRLKEHTVSHVGKTDTEDMLLESVQHCTPNRSQRIYRVSNPRLLERLFW
jgi:hypothetical protein